MDAISIKAAITECLKREIEEQDNFDFSTYFNVDDNFSVTYRGLKLRDEVLMSLQLDPDSKENLFRDSARILYSEYQAKLVQQKADDFRAVLTTMKVDEKTFKESLKVLLSNTYGKEVNENVYKLCTWVDWTLKLWKGNADTQGYMLQFVSQDSNGNKLGKTGKGYSLQALQDWLESVMEGSVLETNIPTASYGFDNRLSTALLAMVKEADYKSCDFEYWQNSIDGQVCRTQGKYVKAVYMKPRASWICSSNQEITYSNWRRYLQIFFTKQLYKDNQIDFSKEIGIELTKEKSAELLKKSWSTVFGFIYQYGIPEFILDYEPTVNIRRNLQLKGLLQLFLGETLTGQTGTFQLKQFKSFIQEIDKDNYYGKSTLQALGTLVEQLGCTHTAIPGSPKPYGTWEAPASLLKEVEQSNQVPEVRLVMQGIEDLFANNIVEGVA